MADNGGPTLTHALLEGSPCIDTGDSTEAPETDQRGEPRVVGASIDIGSYERAAEPCITFTGTLPSWAVIDGNCIKVVPDSFVAANKEAANAVAQAELDAFIAASFADLSLYCGPCGGPARVESSIVLESEKLHGIAYAPTQNLMFVGETQTENPRVFVIDCTDNSIVNTLEFTGEEGIYQMVYGSGQDMIYAVTIGTTPKLFIIDPSDQTFTSVNLPNQIWKGCAYDASRDKIYISDFSTNGQVRSFDCAGGTVDAGIYSSGRDTAGYLAYAPTSDQIYLGTTNASEVHVVNPATLTLTDIVTIPGASEPLGVDFIAYSALADRVVANHHGGVGVVHFIDPMVNVVVNTISTSAQSLFGMVDDECRGALYLGLASVNPRGVGVYDDESPTLINVVSVADDLNSAFAAYCPENSRVYFVFGSRIYVII